MAETKLRVVAALNHSFVGKTLHIYPQVVASETWIHGHPCEAES